MNKQDRCLRHVNSGQELPCSARWISEVLIMAEEALEDGKILLIILFFIFFLESMHRWSLRLCDGSVPSA